MPPFSDKTVLGIDISRWDYEIDVPLLLNNGVKVFVIKIGQGQRDPKLDGTDRRFKAHYANIGRFDDALIMCYFWPEITANPIPQSNWLIQMLEKYPKIKYSWIDAEQWWTDWSAWSKAIKGEIPWSSVPKADPAKLSIFYHQFYAEAKHFFPTGLYTNRGFVSSWAPNMARWMIDEEAQIWLPYYGKEVPKNTHMTWGDFKQNWLPTYTPPLPWTPQKETMDYKNMAGHQFTGDKVYLPGVYQDQNKKPIYVDVNIFSIEWIKNKLGITIDPTIVSPPVPQPLTTQYQVAVTALNVRTGPSAEKINGKDIYPVITVITRNTVVAVIETKGNWAHINAPLDGWCYLPYLTEG